MKERRSILAIRLLLLVTAVLIMTTGIANATPTATRTLPAEPVPADGSFQVEIEASDYGIVVETLPEGFTYMCSSLDQHAVRFYVPTNTIEFKLTKEKYFTYYVALRYYDLDEGTYTFSGVLRDRNGEYVIGGDTEIVVTEPEEEDDAEPTAMRTLPEEPVAAGERFTIEIKVSDYGAIGQVLETLPEGFIYLTSTLDPGSVTVNGSTNTVKFYLICETSFTYTVALRCHDIEEGTYTFSGILNINKEEYEIGGDTEIAVKLAPRQFDTGSPVNPYPSIFGTHTGTVTPSQTITVQKLYTYPCLGTGGHTESIELYENGTLIANGTWNGYKGDWHKIWLNSVAGTPYVTLLKDHVYSYTIRTGSYPGIIHETSFNATGGTITCTDFTDANGKRYFMGWIPAIRFE